MRRIATLVLATYAATAGPSGCAKARYVEVGQGYGVVAIPANTNSWPNYYQNQAADLIRKKCPSGHEVVREGEMVVGQSAHTDSRTETRPPPTLNFGGVETSGGRKTDNHHASTFAGIALPLGTAEQKTDQTTRYTAVTEWWIHYRAK